MELQPLNHQELSDPPFVVGDKVIWCQLTDPAIIEKHGRGPFIVTKVFRYQDFQSRVPTDSPEGKKRHLTQSWMIQITTLDCRPVFFESPRRLADVDHSKHDPFRDFAAISFAPAG